MGPKMLALLSEGSRWGKLEIPLALCRPDALALVSQTRETSPQSMDQDCLQTQHQQVRTCTRTAWCRLGFVTSVTEHGLRAIPRSLPACPGGHNPKIFGPPWPFPTSAVAVCPLTPHLMNTGSASQSSSDYTDIFTIWNEFPIAQDICYTGFFGRNSFV